MQINSILLEIIDSIIEKKGNDILSIKLSNEISSLCEYFIICDAQSTVQVSAIADNISKNLKKTQKIMPIRIHGQNNNFWVIIDYGDIMIHVFQKQYREFYKLEEMWADAEIKKYNFN